MDFWWNLLLKINILSKKKFFNNISVYIKIQMNWDKLIFLNTDNFNSAVFQDSHLCEMKNKNNLKKNIWGKKKKKKLHFFLRST